jgi:ferredoxin-NADP reductase
VATVAETVPETARAVTLRLDVPDWPSHRAGQHVDVRLDRRGRLLDAAELLDRVPSGI